MWHPMIVSEFKVSHPCHEDQYSYFLEVDESQLTEWISRREVSELFGGLGISIRPDPADPENVITTIQIYGKRNCSRFRRIVKELGAELKIIRGNSVEVRKQLVSEAGRRLHRYRKAT